MKSKAFEVGLKDGYTWVEDRETEKDLLELVRDCQKTPQVWSEGLINNMSLVDLCALFGENPEESKEELSEAMRENLIEYSRGCDAAMRRTEEELTKA